MPRPGAYVAQLTTTHVDRIEGVLQFMISCEIKEGRSKAASEIRMILRYKCLRKNIGPKVRKLKKYQGLMSWEEVK